MKSDLYTKMVLTTIAVALAYLCVVQTINIPNVQAQNKSPEYPGIPTVRDTNDIYAVPVVILAPDKDSYPWVFKPKR
jgi:hypothetical protein